MSLDTATVRRVASLARIALDDAEAERLRGELNGILAWVEQLQAVDTEGVAPLAGAGTGPNAVRLRADEVTDGGQAEAVLLNAPDRAGAFFAVPKVVE